MASVLVLLCAFASAAPKINVEPPGTLNQPPSEITGIDVTEHPNAQVDLNTVFRDETGREVKLGEFFQKGRPVILQPAYYRCPMLCTLVSKGIVDSLRELNLRMGDEFQVVTISIDPTETPELAAGKKASSIAEYGRREDAAGWHFLTGTEASIRSVTQAIGFNYKYVESTHEYAHPAAIMVLTPEGRVSRYLYGVNFPAKTLRLSLVEASQGKIGTTIDRVLLLCFHYDPSVGKYTLAVTNLMRAGGAVTVVILAVVIGRMILRERRRRAAAQESV